MRNFEVYARAQSQGTCSDWAGWNSDSGNAKRFHYYPLQQTECKKEAVEEDEGTRPSRRIMWKRKNATVNNNMEGCRRDVSAVYQQSKASFLSPWCHFDCPTVYVAVCLSQQHVATHPPIHWMSFPDRSCFQMLLSTKIDACDAKEEWMLGTSSVGAIKWQRQMWNNVIIHRVSECPLLSGQT